MRKFFLLLLCTVFVSPLIAQKWVDMMLDHEANFYETEAEFERYWADWQAQGNVIPKGKGYKQFQRWAWFMQSRVDEQGNRPSSSATQVGMESFWRTYQAPSTRAAASNWSPMGPFEVTETGNDFGHGRVNVIARDPGNPSILYVGTPAGGLWKSEDGGLNWAAKTDDFVAIGVSGIAIDPNNTDIIYAGTGDGDGGDTRSVGILRSDDGAQTWSTTGMNHTLTQNVDTRKLLIDPSNGGTLYAALSDGLWKSSDSAATWTQLLMGGIKDVEFKPQDPNFLYVATDNDELLISNNGGTLFTPSTNGAPIPSQTGRLAIAVTASQPDWVYLLGSNTDNSFQGVWRSTNSGASFTQMSNSPNIFDWSTDGSGNGGQAWYDMAFAVNPNDSNEVVCGGVNVWKSTDGGASWGIIGHWFGGGGNPYVHADIHSLEYFGNTLYCGSDGGINRTTSAGNSWDHLSDGLQIMQFYRIAGSPMDINLVIGGSQDNGTNLHESSGWSNVLGGDGMDCAIDPTNQNIMYGSYQNGSISRSTDGGNGWSNITPSVGENGAWVTPIGLNPANANSFYVGLENLWWTTDGGQNYTQLGNINDRLHNIEICKADSNFIFVSGAGPNVLYKTTNYGGTWADITPPNSVGFITSIEVDPTNPNKIWVTRSGYTSGNKVYQTNNGGTSWQNISFNLPNIPMNRIVFQEGTAGDLYVGSDHGVYYKASGSNTWQPFMTGLPNVIVEDLEIHYGMGKLRAGTFGRGLWESDLEVTPQVQPEAGFMVAEAILCPGDSISFQDQSVNGGLSWQWTFPGGTPANSTQQHPKISYSTPGNYSATLIVQNNSGADTIAQNFDVVVGTFEYAIQTLTDDYPEETTWEIIDPNGSVVASGGSYDQANTLFQDTVCLTGGCFDLYFYDSYGDGICCSFGNGEYNLFQVWDNTLVATGGQFNSVDVNNFCTPTVATSEPGLSQLQLYPNPNRGDFYVNWPGVNGDVELEVMDALGRTVRRETRSMPARLEIKESPGVYFLKASANGERLHKRLVIQ